MLSPQLVLNLHHEPKTENPKKRYGTVQPLSALLSFLGYALSLLQYALLFASFDILYTSIYKMKKIPSEA